MLILRGFTAQNLLYFLQIVLEQPQPRDSIADRFSRLEVHLKCPTNITSQMDNLTAMVPLCDYITNRFICLSHLSITRMGMTEQMWGMQSRFVQRTLDAVDSGLPGPSDAPIFSTVHCLYLDCPEVDLEYFLGFATRFTQLTHLTLKRISPVFARRDQLITAILKANYLTLRSVDIDFQHGNYDLDAAFSRGVQHLLVTADMVENGLLMLRSSNLTLDVLVEIVNDAGTVVCDLVL